MRRSRIMTIYALVLAAVAVIAIVVMAEGQRRQGRQCLNAGAFYRGLDVVMAPFNRWCDSFSTPLARGPFPTMAVGFPRHALVKARWREIRDEALAVYRAGA